MGPVNMMFKEKRKEAEKIIQCFQEKIFMLPVKNVAGREKFK